MRINLNIEANCINILVLNMRKIIVEVDGVALNELIDVVNNNSYALKITRELGETIVGDPPA